MKKSYFGYQWIYFKRPKMNHTNLGVNLISNKPVSKRNCL